MYETGDVLGEDVVGLDVLVETVDHNSRKSCFWLGKEEDELA